MKRELEQKRKELIKSLIDCRIGSTKAHEIRQEIEKVDKELEKYSDDYPEFVLRERVM